MSFHNRLENIRLRAERDEAMAVAGEANRISRQALNERDAALARAADSDARLVRAIDAAKAAALAALTAPSPAGQLDALTTILDFDADSPASTCPRDPCCQCEPCEYFDGGLDSGDGLDAARKGRTTPSVRR